MIGRLNSDKISDILREIREEIPQSCMDLFECSKLADPGDVKYGVLKRWNGGGCSGMMSWSIEILYSIQYRLSQHIGLTELRINHRASLLSFGVLLYVKSIVCTGKQYAGWEVRRRLYIRSACNNKPRGTSTSYVSTINQCRGLKSTYTENCSYELIWGIKLLVSYPYVHRLYSGRIMRQDSDILASITAECI